MGKPCGVQLSTQGLFYPVAGDRNSYVWKPPGGFNEDFLNVVDIEFI